jgi:MFS family permease
VRAARPVLTSTAPIEGRRAVVAAFALHAVVAGSLGPRLPAIKSATSVSDAGLGVALAAYAAGLFLGTRIAAWPLRRFGSRTTLRAVVPMLGLTLMGGALADDLRELAAAVFVMGVASGAVDVAMNANAVVVERRAGRPIMSGIHGAWSAALLCTSVVAAAAAALDLSPAQHFGAIALAVAVGSVPLLHGLLDDRGQMVSAEAPREGTRTPWSAVLPLGVIGFCSFFGEGSAHDWSAVYLRDGLGTTPAVAVLPFTGFAIGMTASRLVADRLVIRFGAVTVARVGGLAAAAGLGFGLVVPAPAASIAGFTLFGAGLAPVVPLVFSRGGNVGGGAPALGWVVTISYVGGMLGPAVIGLAAGAVGLRLALGVVVLLALVIAALARWVGEGPIGPISDLPIEWPG